MDKVGEGGGPANGWGPWIGGLRGGIRLDGRAAAKGGHS